MAIESSQQERATALLRAFFSPPNTLLWDAFERATMSPRVHDALNPWVDRVREGKFPLVLPCRLGERTDWYIATTERRELQYAREHLNAFLGRSYADSIREVDGSRATSGPEHALFAVFGSNVLRVRVKTKKESGAREAMGRYRELLEVVPTRSYNVARPTGRILADFDEAIRTREAGAATACIEELQATARLDALNIVYLKMYRDEVLEDWSAILEVGERIRFLELGRKPNRASQSFLRAVYATVVAPFETLDDLAGAKAAFEDKVRIPFASLFATRNIYDCREATALFGLLDGKHRGDPVSDDDRWLQAILVEPSGATPEEVAEPISDRGVGELEQQPSEIETGPLDFCERAIREGNENQWDEAWSTLAKHEKNERSVRLIVSLAAKIGLLSCVEEARLAFDSIPESDQESLQNGAIFCRDFAIVEQLLSADGEKIPQSWVEWLEAVAADPGWQEATEVAQRGAVEWHSARFQDLGFVREFESALGRALNQAEDCMFDSMSSLLVALERCPELPSKMSNSLELLCAFFLCHPAPGQLFFRTLADLLDLTLGVGVTTDQYRILLQDVQSQVRDGSSHAVAEGLIEVLSVLAEHRVPDGGQRQSLAGVIANEFVRHRRDPGRVALSLICSLLASMDCPVPEKLLEAEEQAVTATKSDPLEALAGQRVAIYSLKESVLRQVSVSLKASLEGIKISSFSDKYGGSPALRSAARDADVFVIATSAATHAATGFIEANRGENQITVKPAGQGMSSMLRALEDAAEQIAALTKRAA